jgi:hypothetical protein
VGTAVAVAVTIVGVMGTAVGWGDVQAVRVTAVSSNVKMMILFVFCINLDNPFGQNGRYFSGVVRILKLPPGSLSLAFADTATFITVICR